MSHLTLSMVTPYEMSFENGNTMEFMETNDYMVQLGNSLAEWAVLGAELPCEPLQWPYSLKTTSML